MRQKPLSKSTLKLLLDEHELIVVDFKYLTDIK